MPPIRIVDRTDPRLADYRGVSDALLAARNGLFVAEGRLVVRRLLGENRWATRSVLVTEPALAALDGQLARRPDVTVFIAAQDVMNGIAGFDIHRGCLAIGVRPEVARWRDVVDQISNPKSQIPSPGPGPNPNPSMIVVLEHVANADNVGGVFRSAAALGAAAVLLDPLSTDPLYRKAIRTSMGAALQVPFARAEPWPDALRELHARRIAVIAMTPAPGAPSLREVAAAVAGRPVAIVLGHEGDGLTPGAIEACEFRARIPIGGDVDSLNVAAAATIAMYELRRT